jgi:hypothetical protein
MSNVQAIAAIQELLETALFSHFPCLVPSGGDNWFAEMLPFYDGTYRFRVCIERVSSNTIDMSNLPTFRILVSLESDAIEYERIKEDKFEGEIDETEYSEREQDELAWQQHIINSVKYWATDIVEQMSEVDVDDERIRGTALGSALGALFAKTESQAAAW